MWCEQCAECVPTEEYIYLSYREEYKEYGVYIMHTTCIHMGQDEIIESYGSLSLIRKPIDIES